MKNFATTALVALTACGAAWAASPQDTIRKTLAERIPQLAQVDAVVAGDPDHLLLWCVELTGRAVRPLGK